LINIPGELENAEDTARFLSLSLTFLLLNQMPDPRKMAHLKEVLELLKSTFDENITTRFHQFTLMSFCPDKTFQQFGLDRKARNRPEPVFSI